MQEENKFVNIENAKLLKKLGYNIPCKSRFTDIDYIHPLDITLSNIEDTKEEVDWNATKDSLSIPEFEDVRKWLSDKYQISIGMTSLLWGFDPDKEIDKSKILWFCRSNFGVSDGYGYNNVYNKELNRILTNLLKNIKNYE